MNNEESPDTLELERNTIFVLAALLLAALVSIAFFNLDRHPAFSKPSDEFIQVIDTLDAPIIFANDPVALAALDDRHSDLRPAIRPLQTWPPEGPLLNFGSIPADFEKAGMEAIAEESVWTLWKPVDYAPLPFFGGARVELIEPDGTRRLCELTSAGHQCGDAGWSTVRHRRVTVDGERRQCIWAHPIADRVIQITFPPVATETADGRRMWIGTALRDSAVGSGGHIDFLVTVDGEEVLHRHTDRRGWQSARLPAVEEPEELIVEVSAPRVGRRHSCFEFELR
jgi:hypothetical protein